MFKTWKLILTALVSNGLYLRDIRNAIHEQTAVLKEINRKLGPGPVKSTQIFYERKL